MDAHAMWGYNRTTDTSDKDALCLTFPSVTLSLGPRHCVNLVRLKEEHSPLIDLAMIRETVEESAWGSNKSA